MNRFSLTLGASAIALTLASALAQPAHAAASADELQQRVEDLEATIDVLRSEIAEVRKQPDFSKGAPTSVDSKGDSFKFRGQLAGDVAFFNTRKGTKDFNNGTQLRRARLGVDGNITSDWAYRVEIDVGNASRDDNSGQEVDVKDAYVQYKGIENWAITVGQQKTPNTLEDSLASTDGLFVEQPLLVQAATDRVTAGGNYKAGISAKYTDINWTATAGIFGENYSINGGGNSGATATQTYKDEGWGPAARLTYAPINGVTETLHLGASGYWRSTGGRHSTTGVTSTGGVAAIGTTGVQFRSAPEVSVDSTRLVDTGLIDATSYSFVGAELAGQYSGVYLQGEYGQLGVNRRVGSDLTFDGGYVQASYLITGESREYKDGVFARPKPKDPFSLSKGGWGAWEIAARYSTLDLNDGNIVGGKENNYSVGVNWYPNNWIRVLADYIRYDATKGAVHDEGDAFITRVAVIW